MRRPSPLPSRRAGFTLVEVIVVLVLMAILAGATIMYLRPAIESYLAVARRANLTSLSDGAARLISTEVRGAVPNSLRLPDGANCAEFVPTSDGGRFRMAPDTAWDQANPTQPSAPMDLSQPHNIFDVLSTFSTTPAAGDFIVIGNQSADEVYGGASRATIASVGAPPSATLGASRITLTAAEQFPVGYEGGRFVVVPQATQAVTYRCVTPGLDAGGDGTGTLLRYSRYGFNTNGTCVPAATGIVVSTVATHVSRCLFTYDPNRGATQQSGYLEVQLGITQDRETATLVFGVHVDNLP